MLNIYYGRESMDRDLFIFDNIETSANTSSETSTNTSSETSAKANTADSTVLIVPDQFSLQAERDAFHYLNTQALMDIEVLSFSRLSDRVIHETGGRKLPMIDKQGRHMLLTKVMKDSADDLEVYARYQTSSRFLEMANNMISELKQCGISPGELSDINESLDGKGLLSRKLKEISQIYRGYEKAIEGHYIDTEDLASLFVGNIKDSKTVKNSVFWIYGFDVFSPKNLDAIEMLIKYSKGVSVVLTADGEGRDKTLFKAVNETMDRLIKAGENVNVRAVIQKIPGTYSLNKAGELAHIERNLYAMPPEEYSADHSSPADHPSQDKDSGPGKPSGPGEPSGQVRLIKATSVYAEAETAAAHVMKLVREEGYRYRDIVVICNDKGPRAASYKQAFERYGIKVFADEKRSISHAPAATYVLALMQVIAEGYKGEDVIRMLKTGLSDLERNDIEELENYVRVYRINGAQWKKAFYKGSEEIKENDLKKMEELRLEVISPVLEFNEKYKAERTVAGKVVTLYDYLEQQGIPEKLKKLAERQDEAGELEKAAETVQVYSKLIGIMDQMVEIIGEEGISAESFHDLLKSGIEAVEIGVLPPALDGLMMGTMQRTRSGRVKAVIVLGANEGLLPMEAAGRGLLSEKERETLMEVSAKHLLKTDELRAAEESLAIYRNFSRPECQLYVSCSDTADDGQSSRPSMLFERLRKMFPSISVEKDIFASRETWDLIGSPESTVIHMTQAIKESSKERKKLSSKESSKESSDESIWGGVYRWYQKNMPQQINMINKGLSYDGQVDKIEGEFVRGLYLNGRDEMKLSSTRLEKFSGCPFAHFLQYGLKVREQRIYEVGGIEMGDIHHRCLDSFSRKLNAETAGDITGSDSPWMNITEEECKTAVGEIMENIADAYKDGMMHESPAEEYRLKRMKRVCEESAWMAVCHVRKGAFEDMMCEAEFGQGRKLDPIRIETKGGEVMIEGKIDRMDIMHDGKVKIIDYKSGADEFNEDEARAGWQIQLMMYMRAAQENGYEPVGSFYYKLQDPVVSKKKLSDDIEKDLCKKFKMEGVLLGEADVLDSIDKDRSNKSKGKGSSEVYVGGKNLKTRDEFDELLNSVSEKVDEMCTRLMEGDISIKPKRSNTKMQYGAKGTTNKTACTYCPYHSICKFDPQLPGCSYEYV